MTADQLSHLPNTVALAVLIAALLYLQRRQPRLTIGSWVLALSLILSSQISWYLLDNHTWYTTLHVYRLCTDMAAGIIFLLFTGQRLSSTPQRVLRLLWNAAPFFALEMLYGFDVLRPLPYYLCAAAGIAISLLLASRLKRRWTILFTQVVVWIILAACAAKGEYRTAAYWGLGSVYAAATVNLWSRLRRGTAGHAVLVGSISVLSATFFLHPWMMAHPYYFPTAEETWSLQKFFITIGMLLALLEDEALENERLAMKDDLTGLANRRWIKRLLIDAVEHGRVGVAMLDLDGFKEVNDSLGHSTGDDLLRHVAIRLEQITGSKDTLARLGGDEFLIISTRDVKELASSVRSALRKPILLGDGLAFTVRASIGTASFPEDTAGAKGADAVKQLLQVADSRMYAAKKSSANDQSVKSSRLNDRRATLRSE